MVPRRHHGRRGAHLQRAARLPRSRQELHRRHLRGRPGRQLAHQPDGRRHLASRRDAQFGAPDFDGARRRASHSHSTGPAVNKYIAQVINLIPDHSQHLWSGDVAAARRALLGIDPRAVLSIDGSFALVAQDGERVVLARSLERPLRYFLAKAADGPVLIVAERIDEIRAELERREWGDQFHPSYTRMAPAHHVTTLRLIGCPDPNPSYQRFFDPPRGTLPPDLDLIGRHYIEALYAELRSWLAAQDSAAPIGVPFSGGIDSGSVLLGLYKLLLDEGQSPARLKAFTLSLHRAREDARQAREFLRAAGLEILGETIDVPSSALDPLRAVGVIADSNALDLESAC